MIISTLGLSLIALAWIYQLVRSAAVGNVLQAPFVALYTAGVLLLVIDGFIGGNTTIALSNVVAFAAAAGVLVTAFRKRG